MIRLLVIVIDRVYDVAIIADLRSSPFRNKVSLEAVIKEAYDPSPLMRISDLYHQSDDIQSDDIFV